MCRCTLFGDTEIGYFRCSAERGSAVPGCHCWRGHYNGERDYPVRYSAKRA